MLEQRARGGLREGAAGADRDDAELRLQHVAGAGEHQRRRKIGDREHRLQAPQHAVRSPVLRELDRGAHEMALVLFELGLEALEQRERVRGGARKSREHAVVIQAAHLARRRLDHDVAERDLAIAAQRHRAVAAHGNDGRAVKGFHLGKWYAPAARHGVST